MHAFKRYVYRGGPLGFDYAVSADGRSIRKPTDAMVADALPAFVKGFVLVGRKLAGLDLRKGLLSSKYINWPPTRGNLTGDEARESAARLALERSYPEWKDSVNNTWSVAHQKKVKAAARRRSAAIAAAAAGRSGRTSPSQATLAITSEGSDSSGHSSSEEERGDDGEEHSNESKSVALSAGSDGREAVAAGKAGGQKGTVVVGAPADMAAMGKDEGEERGVLVVPPLSALSEAEELFVLEAKTKGYLFYDTHKMITQLRTMHRSLMAQRLAFPTDALFFRWWRTHGNGYCRGMDDDGSDGDNAPGPQPAYMWPLEEGWAAPPPAVSACVQSLCDSVLLNVHAPDVEEATAICTASLLDDLLDASFLYMVSKIAAEREANKTDAERAQEAAELAAQRAMRESALADAALREVVAAIVATEVDTSVDQVLQEDAAAREETASKKKEKLNETKQETVAASGAKDSGPVQEEPDDALSRATTWSSAHRGSRHRITTARLSESKSGGDKEKRQKNLRRSSTTAMRRSMSAHINSSKVSSPGPIPHTSASKVSESSSGSPSSSSSAPRRQHVRRSTVAHHISESKRAGIHKPS